MTEFERLADLVRANTRPALADTIRVVEQMVAVPPREHPLGFVFWQQLLNSRLSLRAHLWFDAEFKRDDGLTLVHDHIYELSSLVVYGGIRNTLFDVSRAPSDQQIVTVDPTSLQIHPEDGGETVAPTAVAYGDYHPGDIYSIAPGVFHSSIVTSSPALTLVTNSPGFGRPRVLTTGAGEIRSVTRKPSPSGAWRASLEHVLEELARQGVWASDIREVP